METSLFIAELARVANGKSHDVFMNLMSTNGPVLVRVSEIVAVVPVIAATK